MTMDLTTICGTEDVLVPEQTPIKRRRDSEVAIDSDASPLPGLPQDNFSKFCYRHNPDIAAITTMTTQQKIKQNAYNNKLASMSQADQANIHNIVSAFKHSSDGNRKLILEGILAQCCFPQLSFVSQEVNQMIKIDFISILPTEISLRILCYLDCDSLCKAASVSRKWARMANDDRVWYHMCLQHIDRKCPNCGWGLPLLHMKRARFEDADCAPADAKRRRVGAARGDAVRGDTVRGDTVRGDTVRGDTVRGDGVRPVAQSRSCAARPWKVVYLERYKVEQNWRRGKFNLKTLSGHVDGVLSCALSPCGMLVTGSYDTTVCLWDANGRLVRRMLGHTKGVKSVSIDSQKLITGSQDGTIKVWNYHTGACISTYRGHDDSVLSVDFAGKTIVSGSADTTVKVWHVDSRTCYTLRGHTEWVNSVKIHGPSFTCFSASDDTTVRWWDLKTNACLGVFKGHIGQVQKVVPLNITYEIETDKEDASAQTSESEFVLPTSGKFPTHIMTASLDNTIKLWDVRTGRCVRTHFGHVEGVWDIAADLFRVVSAAHDGMVKVWDLQSGKCVHTFCGTTWNSSADDVVSPLTCVDLGDSQFVVADEEGKVRVFQFDV